MEQVKVEKKRGISWLYWVGFLLEANIYLIVGLLFIFPFFTVTRLVVSEILLTDQARPWFRTKIFFIRLKQELKKKFIRRRFDFFIYFLLGLLLVFIAIQTLNSFYLSVFVLLYFVLLFFIGNVLYFALSEQSDSITYNKKLFFIWLKKNLVSVFYRYIVICVFSLFLFMFPRYLIFVALSFPVYILTRMTVQLPKEE